MKRLDLDDLPPKLAAVLASVEDGEEILLVKGGLVTGRLTGGQKPLEPQAQDAADQTPEDRAKEVFELFRSSVEDEF